MNLPCRLVEEAFMWGYGWGYWAWGYWLWATTGFLVFLLLWRSIAPMARLWRKHPPVRKPTLIQFRNVRIAMAGKGHGKSPHGRKAA